jgi:hypothetical protein
MSYPHTLNNKHRTMGPTDEASGYEVDEIAREVKVVFGPMQKPKFKKLLPYQPSPLFAQ